MFANLIQKLHILPVNQFFLHAIICKKTCTSNYIQGTSHAMLTKAAPYAVHLSVFMVREGWCAPPCKQATWEIGTPKPPRDNGAYRLLEAAIRLDEGRVALSTIDVLIFMLILLIPKIRCLFCRKEVRYCRGVVATASSTQSLIGALSTENRKGRS